MSDKYDIYKKDLKANYSQGNNKYKDTVVGAYQMALDVSRIYRDRPAKRSSGDKEPKENENKDNEGASFAQKNETKACFKCRAEDYKTCPCDNMKKSQERERGGRNPQTCKWMGEK